MASQVTLWQWASTASGWTGVGPQYSRAEFTSATGCPAGCLRLTASGRTNAASPYFYWEGTWADLGLPANNAVYGVGLASGMWRCSTYQTGAQSGAGPWVLTDSSCAVQATLWAGSTATGSTAAWTTLVSSASMGIGSLGSGSTDTIRLALQAAMDTGNAAGASTHLVYDNFAIRVYYVGVQTITAPSQDIVPAIGLGTLTKANIITVAGLKSDLVLGAPALPSDVTITTVGLEAQTTLGILGLGPALPDFAGLVMWHKADAIVGLANGAEITSWVDSGPGGLELVTKPGGYGTPNYYVNILNGKPVARFEPTTSDMLWCNEAGALVAWQNKSYGALFVVFKPNSSTVKSDVVYIEDGTNGVARFGMAVSETGHIGEFTLFGRRLDSNAAQYVDGGVVVAGTWYIASMLVEWVNATARLRICGAKVAETTAFQTAGTTEDTASWQTCLGSSGGDYFFNGDIAEALWYNAQITEAQAAQVEAYLNARWAVYALAELSGLETRPEIGQASISADGGAATITATGLASSLAIGQASLTTSRNLNAIGLSSDLTLGLSSLTSSRNLDLSGLGSDLVIGQASLTAAKTLSLTSLASDLVLGLSSLSSSKTLTLAGLEVTPGLGLPAISSTGGAQTLSPIGVWVVEDYGPVYLGIFVLEGTRVGTNIELSWEPLAWPV